jgi:hypothetical protein
MRLQFSIRRLLLAVAVFGVVFGATMPLGILSALLFAIPLSAFALVVRASDTRPIIRSVVFSGLGAFVALLCCPMIRPPYEPGDEFVLMMAGALVGWTVGVVSGHWKDL